MKRVITVFLLLGALSACALDRGPTDIRNPVSESGPMSTNPYDRESPR
jgi:hypothetical protein